MVTDRRGALTGARTIYVSLYVYLQDVAVPCVTEGEITLRNCQEQRKTYTRLKKKKKDLVYSNTSCSLVVTLLLNKEKQRTRRSRAVLTLKTSVGMEQNHKGREGKLITRVGEGRVRKQRE